MEGSGDSIDWQAMITWNIRRRKAKVERLGLGWRGWWTENGELENDRRDLTRLGGKSWTERKG